MRILNTLPERAKALRHGTIIERVHCYVGQLVNTTGCKVVRVGGVNDHVHILFLLSRDVAISHVLLSYGVEYDEAYVFKDEGFCPCRARRLYYAETPGCRFACPGYVLHWAFSPSLLNSKLRWLKAKQLDKLTCQPVNPSTR